MVGLRLGYGTIGAGEDIMVTDGDGTVLGGTATIHGGAGEAPMVTAMPDTTDLAGELGEDTTALGAPLTDTTEGIITIPIEIEGLPIIPVEEATIETRIQLLEIIQMLLL